MSAPAISVVMVSYNVERFLAQAIDSVLAERDVDLEILIGDDASTDGSVALANDYARRDPRIRVFPMPHSGRPSVVRNALIPQARGALVCFLDGDDYFLPGRLSRIVALHGRRPDVDVSFHEVVRVDEEGRAADRTFLDELAFREHGEAYLAGVDGDARLAGPRFFALTYAIGCPFHTSSITVRRERLRREPRLFPEDLIAGEDIDLWFRLAESTVAFVDAPLSAYRTRGSSITQRDRRLFFAGTIEAQVRHWPNVRDRLRPDERQAVAQRLSRRWQILGAEQVRLGAPRDARRSFAESLRWRPSLRGALLWGKAALAGLRG
jgi:glycosyltransferase involved in cell wall biosynthesis